MSARSNRYLPRAAVKSDTGAILRIMESEGFPGGIRLMYTRRPDPLESFELEGRSVRIIVSENADGEVAGFGCGSVNDCYLNGQAVPVAYLFGFRVDRSCMAALLGAPAGYAMMIRDLNSDGARGFYTTILADNADGRKFFEKKRSYMPNYDYRGEYTVFTETGQRRHPRMPGERKLSTAGPDTWDELSAFLNLEGSTMNLFPVIPSVPPRDGRYPAPEDFRILRDRFGSIIAAGALWDQTSCKQYIVTGYGGIIRFLQPISSLFPLIGYPALPAKGSILKLRTLSYWAVRDNNPEIYRCFLDSIRACLPNRYLLNIGLSESHPLHRVQNRRPGVRYRSRLYSVGEMPPLDNRPIYLECGRL